MNYNILEKIKNPEDVKQLSQHEVVTLATQIRQIILETVGTNGGHLASNLGVVELTIALHRVFSSPIDAIIWDVGHQCYTHKLLTGRYEQFSTLRLKDGIAGFPKREESCHDIFNTGHASTSISAAQGLLAGRALQNQPGKVIAVIGDGALTGGMAFEAILNLATAGKNLIVILNDNKMSISRNTTAISEYLSRLATHKGYRRFRYFFDLAVEKIPVIGPHLNNIIKRLKLGAKGIFYTNNLFVDLGFHYVGPLNGHHEHELEKVFRNVKNIEGPVLVHVQTIKGKGYSFAESNPTAFHGIGPFRLIDGKVEKSHSLSYTEAFSQSIINEAKANGHVVAVTAAMMQGTGLSLFQHLYPERFFDLGIAEQHAVTFAAGLAIAGLRPIVAIYSTFLQRAIDQLLHDVALQNLPVVFAIDRAGAVPFDGETHQGLYDISFLRAIPNMYILCPASVIEMKSMLHWALQINAPVALRYPKHICPSENAVFSVPLHVGRGVMALKTEQSDVLFVCTGGMYEETVLAADILLRHSFFVDIYHLRFIKPIDEEAFVDIASHYTGVIMIEDGAYIGGIGQYLELVLKKKLPMLYTAVFAFQDSIFTQGARTDLLQCAGITSQQIAARTKMFYEMNIKKS
ncbi:MAG: 1-deoxy-D-xylulose-5-phosphate synthase [Treponema sp.]